jgi:hypothetical protein
MTANQYLLAGQPSELERLQLQSRVWEPSGRRLLEAIGPGRDRALDVACGVLGWLRLLSRWVGPNGGWSEQTSTTRCSPRPPSSWLPSSCRMPCT